jgi:RNA polymerase sigma factor (sigma-70 family)
MREQMEMTKEAFDRLLAWLHPDRELAGEKYEVIRRGLMLFFERRGCYEAAELTDETINRVIKKLPEIRDTYSGEQAKYFYGVARYIYQEYLRTPRAKIVPTEQSEPVAPDDSALQERKDGCRRRCLDRLPNEDRDLIIGYYLKEKREKTEHRRKLAVQYGMTSNSLSVKAFRIRSALHKCLHECLKLMPA